MDVTTASNSSLNLNDIEEISDEDEISLKVELNNNTKRTKEATKDFLNIFKPIQYTTAIFFARKYSTVNNATTPISIYNIFGNIFFNLLLIILCYVTFQEFALIFKTKVVIVMYFIIYFQYIVQHVLLCYVLFKLRIDNYELFVKLEEIYCFLYEKRDVFRNRLCLLIPCIVYCLLSTLLVGMKLSFDPLWAWHRGGFIISTLIFDLEMIHVSYIMFFLAYNMSRLIDRIKNTEACEQHEMKKTFQILVMIVNGVHLTKKAFQMMILYYFVTSFTQTLCYLEILILWIKNNSVESGILTSHTLGVTVWITKGLVVQTALCYCGDLLYRRLETARYMTIVKLGSVASRENRMYLKNILRVCNTSFGRVDACGLFTIDASLPIRVAGTVTTYTIVLLQFAYL